MTVVYYLLEASINRQGFDRAEWETYQTAGYLMPCDRDSDTKAFHKKVKKVSQFNTLKKVYSKL